MANSPIRDRKSIISPVVACGFPWPLPKFVMVNLASALDVSHQEQGGIPWPQTMSDLRREGMNSMGLDTERTMEDGTKDSLINVTEC